MGNDMEWTLADPLMDVASIVDLVDDVFRRESGVFTGDRAVFTKNVTVAATYQVFDRSREFLAVCKDKDKLLGYCWFDRGGYTTYSTEEISNAKFHHVDLSLSPRIRVKLINQMIDQHILWANYCGVPVICSTSIRGEYSGFMKIHEKRGFLVNGSYAWIRTEDAIKGIKNV